MLELCHIKERRFTLAADIVDYELTALFIMM